MITGQPVAVLMAGRYQPARITRISDQLAELTYLEDGAELTATTAELLEVECAWFALCNNTATSLEPHPILGDVPICDRCKAKNETLR